MSGRVLTWLDLHYSVNNLLSNSKIILNKINGSIERQSLTALMGASGAGKSTLIKCLSGLDRHGLTSDSSIQYSSDIDLNICFIFQDQNRFLHKSLTVRQSLTYASKLKNSEHGDLVDHNANVDSLLDEFLLSDIQNNKVKNCSGGQLKRLTIAMELTAVRKPSILFIDEPTTGLDSNAAQVVVKCLHSLTRRHDLSVLSTIHQPNSDLFTMFDKLYVLSKSGICLYSGEPENLKEVLSDCDIACDSNENPIEVLLKISSIGTEDKNIEKLVNRTKQGINKSIKKNNFETNFSNDYTFKTKNFKVKDIYYLLMRRIRIDFVEKKKSLAIETLFHLLFLWVITFAVNEDHSTVDGCFDRPSNASTAVHCIDKERQKTIIDQNIYLLYITSFIFVLTTIAITTKNLMNEIDIFLVELKNSWFSVIAYFWSKSMIDAIPIVINTFLQSLMMCYCSQKIDQNFRFWYYFPMFTISILSSHSFGSIIGLIISGNQQLAVMTSMSAFIVLSFFNNFIIPTKELIWIFQLFSDFTYPKHLFNSLLIIFYGLERCPPDIGSRVLYQYGIDDHDLWLSLIYGSINLVVFKCIELSLLFIKAYVTMNSISRTINTLLSRRMSSKNSTNSENSNNKHGIEEKDELVVELMDRKVNDLPEQGFTYSNSQDSDIVNKKLMIAWVDLTFSVMKNSKQKVLLKNLNGIIEFKTITALMGPSGAGKTTLLKCINGQNVWGLSEESKFYLSSMRKLEPCFVSQNVSDHVVSGLTVEQTLIYASKLKNSEITANLDHRLIANQFMDELLISDIRDTNVCECSGGELKRIVIASELMAVRKPNMVCIDEPTSGLDSNAAQVMISCLRRLTRIHEMSIIVSIHQPNKELFQLFDNVYMLTRSGTHIYSGPPQELITHLREADTDCSQLTYPIETILKIASNAQNDYTINKLSMINSVVKDRIIARAHDEAVVSDMGVKHRIKKFSLKDFWCLTKRNIICSYVYEWKSILLQIILYLMLAINLAYLYNRDISLIDGCANKTLFTSALDCNDTEESLRKESKLKMNVQYNLSFITGTSFIQIIITTMTFTSKVTIFLNEHRNGWYSTGAYYWSKSVVDSVPILLALIIFSHIINYYHSIVMYFVYLYCLSLTVLCAQSFGHLSGIVFTRNPTIAVFVSVAFYLLSSNLSNIFIPIDDFNFIFKTLSNISFLKHSINCILIYIYGFCRCSDEQFSLILYKYNISDDQFYENLFNLIFILVFLRLLTLFVLVLKTNGFYYKRLVSKIEHANCANRNRIV